ncbi:MAG: hypothetical protein WC700_09890 [Gemmatimonadaceae bacterium]|jgi:hypothetical protein
MVLAQAASPAALAKAARAASKDSISLYQIDEVPTAPAFSFLGASPGQVDRPVTPKALALSLVNLVDSAGRLKSGVAFDIRVAKLITALMPDLQTYQSDWWARAWASSSFSFASVQAPGDSGSTDLGFGLRIVLADGNDAMRHPEITKRLAGASDTCIAEFLRKEAQQKEGQKEEWQQADSTLLLRCVAEVVTRVKREASETWNRPSVSIAIASGTRLLANQWGRQAPLGFRAWGSGSLPFHRQSGVLLAQLQYDASRDPAGGKRSSGWTGAVRVLYGNSNYHLFVDLSSSVSGKTSDRLPAREYSAGLEFKASDQLWLSTGLGTRYTSLGDPGKVVLAANLRWRVLSAPQLAR